MDVDQPDMDVLAEQLMPYIRVALSARDSDPDGTKAARLGQRLLTGLLRHEPGRGQFQQAVTGLAEDCDDLEAQSVLSAQIIRILSDDTELAAELAELLPEAAGFSPKVMTEVVDADLVARGTSAFSVATEEDGSACTVVALTDPEGGFAAPAAVAPAAGVIGLSAEGARPFVGRREQIRAVSAAMDARAAVVLTGLGGTGKSALAEHYALSRQAEFALVCRIAAPDPQELETSLAALAAQIHPAGADLPMAVAAQWSRGWLATHDGWLAVLDDVADPEHVARLMRDHDRGRFLVASRHAEGWDGLAEPVRLGALAPDEAIELFTRIVGDRTADLDGVSELCEELGRLPLAVEQAAAYIAQNGISVPDYRFQLDLDRAGMGAPEGVQAQRTIARVWRVTRERLAEDPLAGELARVLAWYAPHRVPRAVIEPLAEPTELISALERLAAYGLIAFDDQTVSTRGLVHAPARADAPDDADADAETAGTARLRATELLLAAAPQAWYEPANRPAWQRLLPLVEALAAKSDPSGDDDSMFTLLTSAGFFLLEQGAADRGLSYLQRALDCAERVEGEDHPTTLALLDILGQARLAVGDTDRAVILMQLALTGSLRVLGEDDPGTLVTANNLSNAYFQAGDLDAAISLGEQVFADRLRVLGPHHPNTLTSINNLATYYEADGQTAKAIPLLERCLAYLERVMGPDHPHTVISRENLAVLYQRDGDVAGAAARLRHTLADHERVLGPDHPDTLISRNNLAFAYFEAGDQDQAIPLFEQNLAARERLFGPDHPLTPAARNNLGGALQAAGRHTEAIAQFEHALADRDRVLGPDHPDTVLSCRSLAYAFAAAQDNDGLARIATRMLADSIRLKGEEHPETQQLRDFLASRPDGG